MDVSEVKVLARRANGVLFVTPVLILLSGFALVYSILTLTNVIEPDKDTLWTIYMFTFLDRHKWRSFNHAWDDKFTYEWLDKEIDVETRFDHVNDFSIGSINLFEIMLWECIICYSVYLIGFSLVFLQRLLTPRIIMEYDNFGVYIYRTGKPVTLLRYEELWSTYAEQDLENVEFCYHRGFYRYRNVKVGNPFREIFKTGSIRIEVPDGFINLGGIYHVKEVEREIKRMVKKNRREFIDEVEEAIKDSRTGGRGVY